MKVYLVSRSFKKMVIHTLHPLSADSFSRYRINVIPSNCIVTDTVNKCNLPNIFINENNPSSTAMNKEFLTQTVRAGNANKPRL